MNKSTLSLATLAAGLALACAVLTASQAPPAAPPQGAPPAGGRGGRAGGLGAGPQRPAIDPAVLERGQGLYSVHCASCHGSEARGGETGPNLLRSPVILEDQDGELLLPIVRVGPA